MLYPNQKIYIVSSVGSQAMETFIKLEDIAKQNIASIPSLKDIFIHEVVAHNSNATGFSHDPAGYRATAYNGSVVYTLNSKPDNVRGKRATLLLIDESAFCSDELISIVLPFITQNSEFKISADDSYSEHTQRKQIPTQVIYSSSANTVDGRHYKVYRDFAKKMIVGDSNYFCCDIPADIPLQPILNGEKIQPLLMKSQIDDEMRSNPEKALREYYNKFQMDSGDKQIIKWGDVRRNEDFHLPQMCSNNNDEKFVFAFDPARINDNSIVSVMKIQYDEDRGYYGEIVNCTNLIELGKKKKRLMKMPQQVKEIRQMLLDYNGHAPDYANIEAFLVDAGAGGGGISAVADAFLEDWKDSQGVAHKGLIDPSYEIYKDEVRNYPNAAHIMRLINPKQFKKQMVEELIELMSLDLIKFPREYDGKQEMAIPKNEKDSLELDYRPLSLEEQVSLINIDIMKTEMTSIHKYENAERTNVTYKLPPEKEKKMNDDRFYTLLLLAHYLYEKRRTDKLKNTRQKKSNLRDYFFSN